MSQRSTRSGSIDLVTVILDHDETFTVTPIMSRWEAELLLRVIGEFGTPYQGRRVTGALIVPQASGPVH